ncbi:MAG: EAL domain-containing protein, partial [Dokdonella sp.]
LIADVDRWMLSSCIQTIGENLRNGRNLRLFISQSLSSARDSDRGDWLRRALEQHRVPASQISLELRMDDAMAGLSDVVAFALAMKQLGTTLTISGFEAGARGNELLRHLPVDFVKLSSRYAQANDDAIRTELRELVRLAHDSGRRVIAPRVEEARIAASLWSSGVDLIQGNFVQHAARDMSYDFHASSA